LHLKGASLRHVGFKYKSYSELWSEWEGQGIIGEHLKNFRERYSINIWVYELILIILRYNMEVNMKSYRKELWFEVPTRRAFINITPQVNECLRESGITNGLVLCNAMHITASVFINDDESGLHHDYEVWLEKIAPHEPVSGYRHNVGEDNADAHMKRQVMGREVVVAITDGKLDFGTWEQIFYGEFDGRRRKRVLVKIIGE
jgi:secondary thiamine-phosphate synthase enzyme